MDSVDRKRPYYLAIIGSATAVAVIVIWLVLTHTPSQIALPGPHAHHTIALVPIVLGAGIPLFTSGSEQISLRLIEVKPLPNGLVQLSYQPNAETDEPGPT
ncbi:MAG: hypothetical protein JSW46_02725 [Gemmatimonadota bacterium]|nr:MAG: hypothetical protein JSW46_02725 [Gemmatimonadota bacterium]